MPQNPVTSTDAFEALRGRLFGLAYRMLGSRAEAEDIVRTPTSAGTRRQPEALRILKAGSSRPRPGSRSSAAPTKTEREAYVGQWLPEPIVTEGLPDRHLDLADDLSIAFLTLLERLSPEERAAFLLHDVFDVGYREDRVRDREERSRVPPGRPSCARACARRP